MRISDRYLDIYCIVGCERNGNIPASFAYTYLSATDHMLSNKQARQVTIYIAMAVQDTQSSACGAVHPLTRLSSQGDYVVVDQQAPQVLRSLRRIRHARSRGGLFYEAYHSTMCRAKAWLYRPTAADKSGSEHKTASPTERTGSQHPAPLTSAPADPYDTSDWADAKDPKHREDYIDAKAAAGYVSQKLYNIRPKFDVIFPSHQLYK